MTPGRGPASEEPELARFLRALQDPCQMSYSMDYPVPGTGTRCLGR
jgi:hypothetical protein